MKKMTKKNIAKAEQILDRLGVAIQIANKSYAECEAEARIKEDEGARSFHAGAHWGMLDTLVNIDMITVEEMFLLDEYKKHLVSKRFEELMKEVA